MAYTLRPYQQEAVDSAKSYLSKCLDACLIMAATGAGKALMVANVARWLHEVSGKKVLCLAPSAELTEQNHEKYLAYGFPASFWSASVGKKCMRHPVVFGTPKSVHNDIQKFGEQFSAVILDEAHTLSPTIKAIVEHMRSCNPMLRVLGLTATPYRLGSGYIYEYDEKNKPVGEDGARDPFFKRLVYSVEAQSLIKQGYLTPPVTCADMSTQYDTSALALNRQNKFDAAEVEKTFEGRGRLTSQIVADVVANSQGKMGVMLFASTIQHAEEIVESLPPGNVEIVTGKTKKRERSNIIRRFKEQSFKYLVSVGALTTGFDAPHVDVVAIMRATESASLLQQIIGRGLRLHDSKITCLVLDYAGNIERHGLEDDLFSPQISVSGGGASGDGVECACPVCGTTNTFSARKGADLNHIDSEGYQLDLAGQRVILPDGQPMPAHHGRRCFGGEIIKGHYQRCDHRWSLKVCGECDAENDIAARYCTECRGELIDPNEKLELDYKRLKKDPRALSTDKVIAWMCKEWVTQRGNRTLRVDYTTEYRSFPVWYSPDGYSQQAQALWSDFSQAVFGIGKVAPTIDKFMEALKAGHGTMPETLTVRKEGDFFKVFAHNKEEDDKPDADA